MKIPYYITISGAYSDTKLVNKNISQEQWNSWEKGETDITKVTARGCFEPCGIGDWKRIRVVKG